MKTLNVRLAAILLGGLLVLGVGIYFWHKHEVYGMAPVFREQARLAKEDKNTRLAIQQLNFYLALRPGEVDALDELASLLIEQAMDPRLRPEDRNRPLNQARALFEEVVRKDPERTEARRKLVELYLGPFRLYDDAQMHLAFLLRATPDDPALLEMLGHCQQRKGQDREAADSYARVIQIAPSRLNTYYGLALLLHDKRLGNPKGDPTKTALKDRDPTDAQYPRLMAVLRGNAADKPGEPQSPQGPGAKSAARPLADLLMEQMVRTNADTPGAYVLHAKYLLQVGSVDEAVKQAKKASDLAPNDREALVLLVRCCAAKHQYDEACAYAARGIASAKDDPAMYGLLAEVKLLMGRRDEAVDVLKQGVEATKGKPQEAMLLLQIADLLIGAGKPAEAKARMDQAAAAAARMTDSRIRTWIELRAKLLRARIELAEEHWATAREVLEKLRPEFTDASEAGNLKQIDCWIGDCYGRAGNVEQQRAAYRRALAVDPFFFPARKGLAQLYVGAGDLGKAIEELRQATKGGRSVEVLIELAGLLLRKNLRLPKDQQQWDEVKQILKQAAEAAPNAIEVPLALAEVLYHEGRAEEAERLLLDLRDKNPKIPELWQRLIILAERQKKWDEAEKLLDEAEKQISDQAFLVLARAQYLVQRSGSDAAGSVKQLAQRVATFNSADQLRAWKALVDLYTRVGEYDEAKRLARQVAEKEPNNLPIRYVLFDLVRLNAEKQQPETLAEIEKLLAEIENISGRGPIWLYGEAIRLRLKAANDQDPLLDQAQKCLVEAARMEPRWGKLPMLAGDIYSQQGKDDFALESYLKAIELGERDADKIRRTWELLAQRHRTADASRLLSQMEEQGVSLTPDMAKSRVEYDLIQPGGNLDRILKKARESVDVNSTNYRDQLWLGRVLAASAMRAKDEGRPQDVAKIRDEAEQAIRRAVALSSKSADCWVTLVQFLVETDRKAAAREEITRARGQIAPQQAPLALGQCYETVGDNAEAETQYKAALAAAPENPYLISLLSHFYRRTNDLDKAEPLLKKLIAEKGKVPENVIGWARRSLAESFAARGSYENRQDALRLVDENLASARGAEDLRLKAKLLLADPRPAKRQEAMQLMEEVVQSGAQPSPQDRFDLAALYLQQKDWENYRSTMVDLLATTKDQPRYITPYVVNLLRPRKTGEGKQIVEISEAEVWLNRLEQLIPNSFDVVSLRADAFFWREQNDKAIDLLTAFLDRPSAEPKDRADRLLLAAMKAQELAQKAATERVKALSRGQSLRKQDPAAADRLNTDATRWRTTETRFTQQAESYYRQFAEQRPGQEMVLAAFLAGQGRFKEALDLMERAWADVPPGALAQAASALFSDGRATPEQVLQCDKIVQAALKKFNRPLALLVPMGDFYTAQGRYQEAEQFYRDIISKEPRNFIAKNNLALLLAFQRKKLDEALELINDAMKIVGPMAAVRDSRATVYLARGEPDNALADLDLALADGMSAIRLFHQAQAYYQAGKKTEAAMSLQAAENASLSAKLLPAPERPVYQKMREELFQ